LRWIADPEDGAEETATSEKKYKPSVVEQKASEFEGRILLRSKRAERRTDARPGGAWEIIRTRKKLLAWSAEKERLSSGGDKTN